MSASPINLQELHKELLLYPDRVAGEKLYSGFQFGFSIHYEGPDTPFRAKNLKSANEHPNVVREKINKEVTEGRVAGPFSMPPFKSFRVSPIGLVPKKEPGQFRLIHHLSYPKGESVNDFIDPDRCSVQYTKFDAAVKMVQDLGKGALLGKADLKQAFRIIPVSKYDFHLLGFCFEGQYYFDKALPFGCSISCAIFELFATFLEWVIRLHAPQGKVEHYLDDYLFGGKGDTDQCATTMATFFNCCQQLGVPVANEKTVGPTTTLIFLGLEIDSILMQIRIPKDKIKQLVRQIEVLLTRSTFKLKEMQALLGSLNFMCRAVVPGRPFCRRLINSTCGVNLPYHHIRMRSGIRKDLQTWLLFFNTFNGISVFHDRFWQSNEDVSLYTDSSAAIGNGFGVIFQSKWTYGVWPTSWHERGLTSSITVLEYFPILVAIYIWGHTLRNKKLLFKCDNEAVVQIINVQTSKDKNVMVLVRALTLKCLQLNLVVRAEHIPGKQNVLADHLSRLQLQRFRELAPDAEQLPESIPTQLWRIFDTGSANC